jgi:hypothetical protein
MKDIQTTTRYYKLNNSPFNVLSPLEDTTIVKLRPRVKLRRQPPIISAYLFTKIKTMKGHKKIAVALLAISMLGFLSSCVVVVHDHPHRHWHHRHAVHERVIIR